MSEIGTAATLGLALGARHALDTDHLVAVTSILSATERRREALGVGFWWGVGHAATLVVVGGVLLGLDLRLPSGAQRASEVLVGAILVALGASLLWRHGRGDVHWHRHRHGAVEHAHYHRHAGGADGHTGGDAPVHRHSHVPAARWRSVVVGGVHGLAGSGPLALWVMLSFEAPSARAGVLLLTAIGSVLGMLAVTLALSVPLTATTSRRAGAWATRTRLAVALGTVVYGVLFGVRALGI